MGSSPRELKPIEEAPQNLPEVDLEALGNIYIPGHKYPPIVGGNFIIEKGKFVGLDLTTGTVTFADNEGWDKLRRVISGKRILVVEERTGDLSLLLSELFHPIANYWMAFGGSTKNRCFKDTWHHFGSVLEWRPQKYHKDEGLKKGWIEIVTRPYEEQTGRIIRTPEEDVPSPAEIETVFKSLDTQLDILGYPSEYFSRPGRWIQEVMLQYAAETLFDPKYIKPEEWALWQELVILSAYADPPGVTISLRQTVGYDMASEDIHSAHLGALAETLVTTPKYCYPVALDGKPRGYETFLSECDDLISRCQIIPGGGFPSPFRYESEKGHIGVLPTIRPVIRAINKDKYLKEEKENGGTILPIRTIFLMPTNEEDRPTYTPLARKLAKDAEAMPFIKWCIKAIGGKMRSYYYLKSFADLPLNESTWLPTSKLPDGRKPEAKLKLPAIWNFITRCSITTKTENKLRRRMDMVGSRELQANQDGHVIQGASSSPSKPQLGEFKTKVNLGTRVAVISDNVSSWKGDGHRVDYLELLDNTDGSSRFLAGRTIETRKGLEVFKGSVPPEFAQHSLGEIVKRTQKFYLGTKKLITVPPDVKTIREGISLPGRFAVDISELNFLVDSQGEGDDSESSN